MYIINHQFKCDYILVKDTFNINYNIFVNHRVLCQYLKNLSVSQRLTHKLLYVSSNNKCGDYNSHEHPREDEAEAYRTAQKQNQKNLKEKLVSNFQL